MKTESSMMRQIESIPQLMGRLREDLPGKAAAVAVDVRKRQIRKVILTGCGDSYSAAMAAKWAFLKYTELDVKVESVIELSRYYEPKNLVGEQDVLVVIISNSGNVSRCIELARRVTLCGGLVLGVTGTAESGLYRHSSLVLKMDIPPFDYAPGIRSYSACVQALFLLAAALGQPAEEQSAEPTLIRSLKALEEILPAYIEAWKAPAMEAARRFADCRSFEWIGSGPGYVNGWFAYAKLLETAGLPGGAYNTEDWFHMNYFIKDVAQTATILFARAEGKDRSRAAELLDVAADMGRPLLCITDRKPDNIEIPCILVPPLADEILAIFTDYIPAAMITAGIGELSGEAYFRDGKDHWTACVDFATVAGSRQMVDGEEV